MELSNKVRKGDKYLTVHYWGKLEEVYVCSWPRKPTKEHLGQYQIGEIIEL